MAEVLKAAGYNTSCVGFTGNPASRGFDTYLNYSGWGSWAKGRSPKAQNLNEVAIPELDRLVDALRHDAPLVQADDGGAEAPGIQPVDDVDHAVLQPARSQGGQDMANMQGTGGHSANLRRDPGDPPEPAGPSRS